MIVEASNLTKRFGRHEAVHDVSLSVPKGSAVALVGANGAGKSTTLRMLMNILAADSGEASVFGVDSRKLGAEQYFRIGYMAENQKLPDELSVDGFFNYLRPLYPGWDHALEIQMRGIFDLPPRRRLGALSRGMRMKAMLAGAMCHRPELLVLDEPLSGLDPLVREEVMEALIAALEHSTILISSHELAEVEGCVTHVAFLAEGRLVFQDDIETLAGRFRTVTAGFQTNPDQGRALPATWLSPQWNGSTLMFVDTAYSGDGDLRRQLTQLGELAHLGARPMSLRETSTALMRAERDRRAS